MPVAADTRSNAGAGPQQPYVCIEQVSKHFGAFAAVDAVSLEIQRGEIFCLLGGSGSGKTTLLRMLAGFETPSSGRILIDGQDMSTIAPYERPVNMMFQSYALFPHMTVRKNVAFGLEQEHLSRQEIARRVAEILDIVAMTPYLERKPHQLSGGQRQRVALARALVKRPKLLLLDEPLAALDRKLREHTQFELLNIQQRLGVTFVVVTHDQQEAMTLATRMGVMDRGRIVQVGTPAQVYEAPATRFVADFIGTVNLLEGRVTERSDAAACIHCQELGTLVRTSAGAPGRAGDTVWVALRPERIALRRAAPEDPTIASGPAPRAANEAHGRVREIAYLGDTSIYLVAIDSGKLIRVAVPNVQLHERIGRDEHVLLSWHDSSPVVLAD